MRKPQVAWAVRCCFLSLLGAQVLLGGGCRRSAPQTEERVTEAKPSSPTPAPFAKPVATPAKEADIRTEMDLAGAVGRRFDASEWEKHFGTPMPMATSAEREGAGERALTYRGGQNPGLKALLVRTKEGRVAVLDLNLDAQSPQGSELTERLLRKFTKIGHRGAHMLGSSLEETKVPFDELEQRESGIRALMSQREGVTRVILYDGTLMTIDETLPSVNALPAGLLERARKVLERQKQQHSVK